MSETFQVVVIGAGPGGYTAAIRAAQLGLSTAIIEREKLGGICLNWGCIPTKALLQSAHLLEEIRSAGEFGIKAAEPIADFPAIIARSRKVAAEMEKGVAFLMKKNKVTVLRGEARFIDAQTIELKSDGENKQIHSDNFIVAVGARVKSLPGINIDGKNILGYREALTQESAPKKLGIVGAGAIGIEFADFYSSMGSDVTVLEYLPRILPLEDEDVSKQLARSLKRKNINILNGVQVENATTTPEGVTLSWKDASGKVSESNFNALLMATGIEANTDALGLRELGVKMEKDRIAVDDRYSTNVKGIRAIGDCIVGPALAHVAGMEGIRAAEAIALEIAPVENLAYETVNYSLIPSCTYCKPEVASVGLTEQSAREQGMAYKVGKFPFSASGRAKAQGDTQGFIKVIADEETHRILGAHIIGPNATELIAEFVLGANMELTVENFAKTIHAHPTLSEGVMEGAADVLGEAINL